jgi:hypothetical protein
MTGGQVMGDGRHAGHANVSRGLPSLRPHNCDFDRYDPVGPFGDDSLLLPGLDMSHEAGIPGSEILGAVIKAEPPESARRVAVLPPGPRLFSNTVTSKPRSWSIRALINPERPAPITATRGFNSRLGRVTIANTFLNQAAARVSWLAEY